MKNWEKLKLIKDNFYTYYRMAGYDKVASSPLIPKDDQTIFFSNSAIVSFKPYLDKESPRLFKLQVIEVNINLWMRLIRKSVYFFSVLSY